MRTCALAGVARAASVPRGEDHGRSQLIQALIGVPHHPMQRRRPPCVGGLGGRGTSKVRRALHERAHVLALV